MKNGKQRIIVARDLVEWRLVWKKIEPAVNVASHLALLMTFLLLGFIFLFTGAPVSEPTASCTENALYAGAVTGWPPAEQQIIHQVRIDATR